MRGYTGAPATVACRVARAIPVAAPAILTVRPMSGTLLSRRPSHKIQPESVGWRRVADIGVDVVEGEADRGDPLAAQPQDGHAPQQVPGRAPTTWSTRWTASPAGRCRHRRSARSRASCPAPSTSSRPWSGAGSPTTRSRRPRPPPPGRPGCRRPTRTGSLDCLRWQGTRLLNSAYVLPWPWSWGRAAASSAAASGAMSTWTTARVCIASGVVRVAGRPLIDEHTKTTPSAEWPSDVLTLISKETNRPVRARRPGGCSRVVPARRQRPSCGYKRHENRLASKTASVTRGA
jgi:hypothetical protein